MRSGSLLVVGGIALTVLPFQRLFMKMALGNRHALLITRLMVVLSAQLIALGLVGELVFFAHGKTDKDYTVAETSKFDSTSISVARQ